MTKFTYTITDALGIHARPAGLMVKEAAKFKSSIKIECNGKLADAKRLLALMGLAVKTGQTITIAAEGEDEPAASKALEKFCKENL